MKYISGLRCNNTFIGALENSKVCYSKSFRHTSTYLPTFHGTIIVVKLTSC